MSEIGLRTTWLFEVRSQQRAVEFGSAGTIGGRWRREHSVISSQCV